MAEGDTILRAAQRIEQAICGEPIEVLAPSPRGRAVGVERVDGGTLIGVEAVGKNLLLDFGELALHSHLGMSGAWHVYPRGGKWRKPAGSAWAVLRGERQEAVQFGGPTLRVMPASRLRRELAKVGPDVLAPDFDLSAALARMRAVPERGLGDALLDQSLVAGIGNIFKSEACFAVGLDPWRPVGSLSDDDLRAVLGAARRAMQESVAYNRRPDAVYRRRGPCPRCGAQIDSRGQGDANRRTYWCPGCQA
jgi:endonuclease-8